MLRLKNVRVSGVLATLMWLSIASAQWAPPPTALADFKPYCGPDKKQLKVRLDEGTKYLMAPDVAEGDILYGIKFRFRDRFNNLEGLVYCKPYKKEELGLLTSHSTRRHHAESEERGYFQCLYDIDGDGVFDRDTRSAVAFPNSSKDLNHQYKYSKTTEGIDYPCKSFNPNSAEEIAALGSDEVGLITDLQQIDHSIAGDSAGSAVGGAVASAKYYDSTAKYSAMDDLKATFKGAMLGSFFDRDTAIRVAIRYTVKTMDGEVKTADTMLFKKDFPLAKGLCVQFPTLEKLPQKMCEKTLASNSGSQKPSKEARLLELKVLNEKGLVSDALMLEMQKKILSED